MSEVHTIQVENTLHIMPSDEADLHTTERWPPCPCKPKYVWINTRTPILNLEAIKLHRPLTGDSQCLTHPSSSQKTESTKWNLKPTTSRKSASHT